MVAVRSVSLDFIESKQERKFDSDMLSIYDTINDIGSDVPTLDEVTPALERTVTYDAFEDDDSWPLPGEGCNWLYHSSFIPRGAPFPAIPFRPVQNVMHQQPVVAAAPTAAISGPFLAMPVWPAPSGLLQAPVAMAPAAGNATEAVSTEKCPPRAPELKQLSTDDPFTEGDPCRHVQEVCNSWPVYQAMQACGTSVVMVPVAVNVAAPITAESVDMKAETMLQNIESHDSRELATGCCGNTSRDITSSLSEVECQHKVAAGRRGPTVNEISDWMRSQLTEEADPFKFGWHED